MNRKKKMTRTMMLVLILLSFVIIAGTQIGKPKYSYFKVKNKEAATKKSL